MTAGTVPHRIAIVGAGVTGLAAALRLVQRLPHAHIDVFDAADRAGGLIRTEHRDGFLMECGPDSFITNKPDGIGLCEELGIVDQMIPTSDAHRRSLVLRNGRPCAVPDGFLLMAPTSLSAVLKSPVLSVSGKLRLLAERFVPPRTDSREESLAEFVTRRFGRETLERLVQPLIGGIYTSDPEKLSLQATLPRFIEMEQTFGSIIRATRGRGGGGRSPTQDADVAGSGARYGLFLTHRDGLSALVDRCVDACRQSGRVQLHLKHRVESLAPPSGSSGRWKVTLADNAASDEFDAVLITLSAPAAARLLTDPQCAELCRTLSPIEYASTAIVVSGHRLADFHHPLDAFGLVIPEIEHRSVLAVSFSSRKFSGRAPDGHILLRTFVGGAMHPELLEQDDPALETMVCRELQGLLGMQAPPQFVQTVRYENSMPQYHVGHAARVQAVFDACAALPGLELAGSSWHGVGIPDSIRSGRDAAERIAVGLRAATTGTDSN